MKYFYNKDSGILLGMNDNGSIVEFLPISENSGGGAVPEDKPMKKDQPKSKIVKKSEPILEKPARSSNGKMIRELLAAGTPVREIAEKVGVTEANVYYHKKIMDAADPGSTVPEKKEYPFHLIESYGKTLIGKVDDLKQGGMNESEIAAKLGESLAFIEDIFVGLSD